MKTHLPKVKDIQANREWYLIDAAEIAPGRVATLAAIILRGKHKPSFTPHLDTGDGVIVVNASKIVLTGNKALNKNYYRHSGKLGELKTKTAGKMLEDNPEKIIFFAVKGMIPATKNRKDILKRLKIYTDESHAQEAQKPKKIAINAFGVNKTYEVKKS